MAALMRETHPLTLKVMRLSRPQLSLAKQLPVDSGSVVAAALSEYTQNHPTDSGNVLSTQPFNTAEQPLDNFPVTETLVLPKSFGTMYLGETFSAHLCVCNESTLSVRDVSVRVAMQTQTHQQQPFILHNNALGALATAQAGNIQVAHEIKELGTHILACAITYLSAQGERKTLQKSFKFQVANPLIVKTKVNHLNADVLLEVQVQNATQATMALERLRFDPAEVFTMEDLSAPGNAFLQAGDIRQHLYRLRPKPAGSLEEERAVRYAAALGKLDILWRGAFGSVGRLQTSQLVRKSPGMFPIDIARATVSEHVRIEAPFTVNVELRNLSEHPMDLVVAVGRQPNVVLCGLGRRELGMVDVGESKELALQFVPLQAGVQRVGMVRVKDVRSGYTRDVDHLVDVAVSS
ncbi:DUF974-domain-containing protein [Linderina pennispora]|uniref:DUF974-domain-containing protein n=1 Tax=Linderina pennispora TaxID=61395 RepID=A0A1Y1W2P7_9FUNG|nr:DUF974-domain-containing protein [Linderina pennispora]ORX67546.1 DUF974-domain-containing protein [Linderina pennispora]